MLKLSSFWKTGTEEFAAVDLGSNSFHMIVARVVDGEVSVIDRLKETVRLGYGLDENGNLDELAQQRAVICLSRFHQRIRHIPASRVRAVGTRTLRQATNASEFIPRAEAALGFDIQIVSGVEEARLVYQGIAFGYEDDGFPRLVIDIGGGSTEVIIGEGAEPKFLESFGMGCVSISKQFFANNNIEAKKIRKADIYCQQKLEPFQHLYRDYPWNRALGCSGSIRSIAKVIMASHGHPNIHLDHLEQLIKQVSQFKTIDDIDLPGLSSDRKPVFLGGLIILRAAFIQLNIESIEVSDWALREGVLFDLLGYADLSEIRDRSVQNLANRFHYDTAHAQRVLNVARKLWGQIDKSYLQAEDWYRYVEWSCLLLEIGLDINHNRYHDHSAYIVAHSHLAGFGYDEQNRLAFLVGQHRKKIRWDALPMMLEAEREACIQALVVLRLAAILTRARTRDIDIAWTLQQDNSQTFLFSAAPAWWQQHPLASADLETEAKLLGKGNIKLVLQGLEDVSSDTV